MICTWRCPLKQILWLSNVWYKPFCFEMSTIHADCLRLDKKKYILLNISYLYRYWMCDLLLLKVYVALPVWHDLDILKGVVDLDRLAILDVLYVQRVRTGHFRCLSDSAARSLLPSCQIMTKFRRSYNVILGKMGLGWGGGGKQTLSYFIR